MLRKLFYIALGLFVLFEFLFGFPTLRMFFHRLFGTKPKNVQSDKQSKTSQTPPSSSASQKIIASDEGEYVDYVEIKD